MTGTEPTLWGTKSGAGEELVLAIVDEHRGGEVAELVALAERAREYARNAKAANTLRAYESDLRHFGAWCEARGLVALPATGAAVAYYLTDHGGALAVSTLRRRLAAISEAHKAAWHPNPTSDPAVRIVWGGIRRTLGLTTEQVHLFLATGLSDVQQPEVEEDERIELVSHPLAELDALIDQVCDSKTLIGLLELRRRLA